MTTSTSEAPPAPAAQRRSQEEPAAMAGIAGTGPRRFGVWAAVVTALCAAAAFAVGILTPVHSGPSCTGACITYPYTNVAAFVPRDYLWMYPGVLAALGFVVLMSCLHRCVEEDTRLFGQIGVTFAAIAATLINADYSVQLAVLQPSLLKGETDGLSLFSMYNPHGIFIALEDVGYLMMSIAFLFAGLALGGQSRLERVLRWLFIISALAAIALLLGLTLIYGKDLEYRFEVAVLGINWTVLIVAGALLAVLFKRTAGRPVSW